MAQTITPTEFAATVSSDGKTVRKFLRSITPKDEQPGKGSRWALPASKREVTALTKRFRTWEAEEKAARAERAQKAAEEAAAAVETDEVDETE
jgi:hypothetical protein